MVVKYRSLAALLTDGDGRTAEVFVHVGLPSTREVGFERTTEPTCGVPYSRLGGDDMWLKSWSEFELKSVAVTTQRFVTFGGTIISETRPDPVTDTCRSPPSDQSRETLDCTLVKIAELVDTQHGSKHVQRAGAQHVGECSSIGVALMLPGTPPTNRG